jgi:hypothetical protein
MGSKVNYKPLFADKIKEFIDKCPSYTLSEVVYSILRQLARDGHIEKSTNGSILEMTDQELYSVTCKALKEASMIDEPIEPNTNSNS